jgi:hypothetical protein
MAVRQGLIDDGPQAEGRWGNQVSLSDERMAHILEYPEMRTQEDKIARTLLEPDVVVQSQSDGTVRLFHSFYEGLPIGDKHLCVVVKYTEGSAFVITAYLTDRTKKGEVPWRK